MNRLGVHMHSFRRLEELQVLVLASNKLVGVHPSVWSLTSLVRLDLGHNNLTELPADVSQLTGLTVRSTLAIAQHHAKHHAA
jgi:Leucine-rich repeat (LRR) protein